ncbi:MAG TPA: hypothetical protein VMV60_03515 [Thermoanaerobaculia bacterium]|nr:hypothetical protein [Thermoanaerobaculia bacterium]
MRKIASLLRRWDHLVPWLILAVVGGATLAALQVLVVKLLH